MALDQEPVTQLSLQHALQTKCATVAHVLLWAELQVLAEPVPLTEIVKFQEELQLLVPAALLLGKPSQVFA